MGETPLGAPVASGRTAEIFSWGEGTILKLFHCGAALPELELERHNATAARACGVATPAVHDLVRHGRRWGLVFERVDGPTLLEKIQARPEDMQRWATELARLHLALHQAPVRVTRLPDQRQRLERKIRHGQRLAPAHRAAVLGLLERLPAGSALCHGDFHPANVIMSADGPVIIDWIDAALGNPLADVARTSVVLLGHLNSGGVDEQEKAGLELFHETYLHQYMGATPDRWTEYEQWLVVAAAARLTEDIAGERDWLLAAVREGLRAARPRH